MTGTGSSKKEISAPSQAVEPLKKDHVYNKAELAKVRSLSVSSGCSASCMAPHAPLALSWHIICRCSAETSDSLWVYCSLQFNGTHPSRAVLVAIRGKVFDVTVLDLSCRIYPEMANARVVARSIARGARDSRSNCFASSRRASPSMVPGARMLLLQG